MCSIIKILLPLLLAQSAFATTYHITSGGAGSKDGGTKANACEGFSDADCASPSNGDVVCVYGTFEATTASPSYSGATVTLRGDCDQDDPAIFDGSTDYKGTAGSTWADQGSNVWRRSGAPNANTYGLWLNGFPAQRTAVTVDVTGEFKTLGSNQVDLYSTSDPASAFSSIRVGSKRDGLVINGQSNLTIQGFRFIRFMKDRTTTSYTSSNDYGHTQGALRIQNSSNITVTDISCDNTAFCIQAVQPTNSNITVSDVTITNPNSARTDSVVGVHVVGLDIDVSGVDYDGETTYYNGDSVRTGVGILSQPVNGLDAPIRNIDIHDNEIYYFAEFGVFISDLWPGKAAIQDWDIDIYRNYIHDSRDITSSDDADCIGIGGNDGAGDYTSAYATGIWVYGNLCEEADNAGIHFANFMGIGSGAVGNVLINAGSGLSSAAAAIFTKNGALIAFNTVVMTGTNKASYRGGGIEAGTVPEGLTDATINQAFNNIVQGVSNATQYAIMGESAGLIEGGHNLVYGNTNNYSNFTNANGLTDDPELKADYSIDSGSPAYGAGIYKYPWRGRLGKCVGSVVNIGATCALPVPYAYTLKPNRRR